MQNKKWNKIVERKYKKKIKKKQNKGDVRR